MEKITSGKLKIDFKKYSIEVVLLSVYCAFVPLENIWVASAGGSVNKYIGLIIMALLLISVIKKRKLATRIHYLRGLYLLFAMAMLSNVYSMNSGGWASGKIVLNMVVFLVLILQYPCNEEDLNFIKVAMVLVAAILSVMVSFGVGLTAMTVGRATLSIGGHAIDQNNLAVALAMPGLCAFDMTWRMAETNRSRILYMGSTLLIAFAILMTGSRGGLMAFIVSIGVYIMLTKGKLKWQLILAVVILAILGSFAMEYYLPEDIASRFTLQSVLQSGGTGRTDIWLNALREYARALMPRQLFGYGFGTFPYFHRNAYGIYAAAHNDLIQVLIELGIVGLGLYGYMWCVLFGKAKKCVEPLAMALLICTLIAGLSMEMLVKKMFWNALFLAIVQMQIAKQTNA